ncbi:LOW QUALITY PROTEIN: hypothetical protein PanWU01x14_338930 [Parasponia andersonii]|uniref:LRR domain containing protein n=1 Tax=Parasponia andersonii TaxID=3476 RepID=A0A2P5AF10_PARAD|nr:LOW QUALITY PROTEIN: hypothetical protein PanWU01x14_338930 [Parasponia andersonii]
MGCHPIKSFFQNLEKDDCDGNIESCKKHTAQITKNECITIEDDDVRGKLSPLHKKARYLMLMVGAEVEFPPHNKLNEKNIRTLFIMSYPYDFSIGRSFFLQLRCLRTLLLRNCGLKMLPESIGGIIHVKISQFSIEQIT